MNANGFSRGRSFVSSVRAMLASERSQILFPNCERLCTIWVLQSEAAVFLFPGGLSYLLRRRCEEAKEAA